MTTQSMPRTLNTRRSFPPVADLEAWEARRQDLRSRILVSCGLYPLPPRTPLKPKIFDRVIRDGYTIEKVALQTYPGFYLAGNLYRPTAATGPSPGVLVAHGHWEVGRMANTPEGSLPARAITFARMGCVAFTYDMVGYNDTRQIDHRFANDRRSWLWGVTLMGLQTWNSLRALDFLAALPDVDASRLAITGESGGGTQTMILGAIDARLAATAPCVMVSHTMQGGCLCENAPGLRIEHSNMEIAAASAPRPQILVGATGDWTATTMTVEGPALESIYRLYDRTEALNYVIVDAGHNINRTSREHVYAFFGKHLLGKADPEAFREPPYEMEPVAQLRVFPDDAPLPPDARTATELTDDLIALGESALLRSLPRDRRSLSAFKRRFRPLWEQTLALHPTARRSQERSATPIHPSQSTEGALPAPLDSSFTMEPLQIDRGEHGGQLSARLYSTPNANGNGLVLVHPEGMQALQESDRDPTGPLYALLKGGYTVLVLDAFQTGANASPELTAHRNPFEHYFTTYNRTDLQERVQDLILGCNVLRTARGLRKVGLIGLGEAGLWAVLAAPAADAVAADCVQLDLTTDDVLLTDARFTPGLRRMGDFRTAATLAVPNPLLLHNTGERFTALPWITAVYTALGADGRLSLRSDGVGTAELLEWTNANLPQHSR